MGSFGGTSHSGPYPYLQRVPLVFFGPGFVRSMGELRLSREVTVADIAATQAQLLGSDFPQRDSIPITELLRPHAGRPDLIVTVTIDGGGWNVLNRWPNSWPVLRHLMERGASVVPAIGGSSPSVTPAIHTNISTGTFPRVHGITGITIRRDDGSLDGAYSDRSGGTFPLTPSDNLRVTTLPDIWDQVTDNEALVGLIGSGPFVIGLVGHGSSMEGGDKDIVGLLARNGSWSSDRDFYRLPPYVNSGDPISAFVGRLDREDGSLDNRWLDHDLDEIGPWATPAAAPWQTGTAKAILEREGFGKDRVTDLFYLHYKSPDHAGHEWNMINPEVGQVIHSVDSGIGELVEWLNERIGRNRYLLVVTADHGQTPLDAGGWPISVTQLIADINERFDSVLNDRSLISESAPTSLFLDRAELKTNEITSDDIARFLTTYTIGENNIETTLRAGYRAEDRIFAAVTPGWHLPAVMRCAGVDDFN